MNDDQNNILIVDDEPDMCWALTHILQKHGYASRTALTGEDAMRCIETERFALIFLDAKLPDIEGLDLAIRIREFSPSARIIIVSGYFYKDDIDIQEAVEKEIISGFIAKPFDQGEIAKVAKVLAPLTSEAKKDGNLP